MQHLRRSFFVPNSKNYLTLLSFFGLAYCQWFIHFGKGYIAKDCNVLFVPAEYLFIPNSRNNLGSDSISMSSSDGLPPNGLLFFGSILDFTAKDFVSCYCYCYWFILFIFGQIEMFWICLDSIVMSFYCCQVCHCIAVADTFPVCKSLLTSRIGFYCDDVFLLPGLSLQLQIHFINAKVC